MRYGKSIIICGIVIPGMIIAAIVVAAGIGYAALSSKAEAKEKRWTAHKQRLVKIASLEKILTAERAQNAYQKQLLESDIQSTLSPFLDKKMAGPYATKLLKQSVEFPSQTGLDQSLGAGFRMLSMSFLGRFDAMQSLAMVTEMKFPQLSLTSYSIQRVEPTTAIPSPHLAFKMAFKAYNNN